MKWEVEMRKSEKRENTKVEITGSFRAAIIAAMIFALLGFFLLIPVERFLKKRKSL